MQKSSRSIRALRGALAALFATVVALISHVLAGGQVHGLLGLMLPLSISIMVCTLLSGRRFSLFRLSIAVAVSQFFFHGLFTMGADHPGSMIMPANSGHDHLMDTVAMASTESLAMAGHAAHDGSMMFAHILAAIATILVLHRSESILFTLSDLADLFFLNVPWFLVAALRFPFVERRPQFSCSEPPALVSAVYVSCVARRGPPAFSLV